MKINWGSGIVIAFIVFIGFILFLIMMMMTDDKLNHELVTEEYYKKGTYFQQEIDAERNSQQFSESIIITKSNKGILFVFPKDLEYSKIDGTIFFYRPSNKNLDFKIPLVLSGNQFFIPEKQLVEGRWDISVNWEYKDVNYLFKDKITY